MCHWSWSVDPCTKHCRRLWLKIALSKNVFISGLKTAISPRRLWCWRIHLKPGSASPCHQLDLDSTAWPFQLSVKQWVKNSGLYTQQSCCCIPAVSLPTCKRFAGVGLMLKCSPCHGCSGYWEDVPPTVCVRQIHPYQLQHLNMTHRASHLPGVSAVF